jgi:hypothetical protein
METIRETEYTTVICKDEAGAGNACHSYEITHTGYGQTSLTHVEFQNGPIQENGVNGCQNEDLLAIVIHRLQGFQSGQYACRENAIALTKIQEALMWCEKRTADRKARNVEGKSIV